MRTLQIIVFAAFAISVIGFVIVHIRANRKSQHFTPKKKEPRSSGAPMLRSRSVAEMLPVVVALRTSGAQWAEILDRLNPDSDHAVHSTLLAHRGPHMFDPRTGLGVIETGLRSVGPSELYRIGLEEAVRSMNKVLNMGN